MQSSSSDWPFKPDLIGASPITDAKKVHGLERKVHRAYSGGFGRAVFTRPFRPAPPLFFFRGAPGTASLQKQSK